MNNLEYFLSVEHVSKSFKLSSINVSVLKDVSFQVRKGSWIALLGASGSGKTTLLDIIGVISKPDHGKITIDGIDTTHLSSGKSVAFRRKKIGFVFQAYHILPELNILENVMLPALLDGKSSQDARKRAEEILDVVGLSHRIRHRANELSGGEQQRAAIARAVMNFPQLILADEPTGNLDSKTGEGILELFRHFKKEYDTTIVMVTHDRTIANIADSSIELKDGCIVNELA